MLEDLQWGTGTLGGFLGLHFPAESLQNNQKWVSTLQCRAGYLFYCRSWVNITSPAFLW